ncbi:MAG: fibronectin type III domain-containing protein [Candidatus Pacebacteria bacterium]|nr:fibronectin type III domain-containing protein [Candidatus Paceibacterota bacterium]
MVNTNRKDSNIILAISATFFLIIAVVVWGISFAESGIISPTNLVLKDISNDSTTAVELKWSDNSNNETQFIVERKSSIDGGITTENIFLSSDVTSYIDRQVVRGASYYYKVMACSVTEINTIDSTSSTGTYGTMDLNTAINKICSGYTNQIWINIPSLNNNIIVSAPTNLVLKDSSTSALASVTLNWTDTSENENKFVIERKAVSDINAVYTNIEVGSNITSHIDTQVVRGTSYFYKIKACIESTSANVPVCSLYTNLVEISIPSLSNIITVHSPTNLYLKDTSSSTLASATLNWRDNSDNETEFIIERRSSSDINTTPIIFSINSNTTSYVDSHKITRGVPYYYRVKACVVAVNNTSKKCSEYTNTEFFSVPIQETIKIVAPTNLLLKDSSTDILAAITLNWLDNSSDETQFVIERRTSGDVSTPVVTFYTNSNTISYRDLQVNRGVTYHYRIKACSLSLNSTEKNCSVYTNIIKIIVPNKIINTEEAVINTTTTTTTNQNITTETKQVETTTEAQKVTLSPTQTTEVSSKIQDISVTFEEIKIWVNNTKEQLIKIINETVFNVIRNNDEQGRTIDEVKIFVTRDELINKINSSLLNLTIIKTVDIDNLKNEIYRGILDIKNIAEEESSLVSTLDREEVSTTLNLLTGVLDDKSEVLNTQNADLLYKDTNNDGISDYDSKYVYGLDPVKPSPVSIYEGKNINASDKILLGFDPTSTELVKINIEEPEESKAPIIVAYKVKELKLTDKNEIFIRGEALPNSFITLYIYSTPIIVTIKTDNNGEWQYLLDKELENGDHTVYAATVNNTGNIVAKSSGYLFTKTAEALTFQELPVADASINVAKPGLLEGTNLYIIIASSFLLMVILLVTIGMTTRKSNQI